MDTQFSQQELAILQSKAWWVACNQTPFLVRSATFQNNTILLTITDLRVMWGARYGEQRLMKDKQIYAKTLEVSNVNQLVSLFEGILSNPEQKAVYKFIRRTSGDLTFQIQKQIQVYPLTWKFQLGQLDCDIVNMMCKDIINPLIRTLNAQEKRMQITRNRMKILQQNLLRRMTQTQKLQFKSQLLQNEQDLKLLVRQPKQQEFISDLRMQSKSKFFFQLAMIGFKNLKKTIASQKSSFKQKQKSNKVQKRIGVFNSQLNAQQILNQLQMKKQDERQKKKKKKKIDFI